MKFEPGSDQVLSIVTQHGAFCPSATGALAATARHR
jgi:hypothetical protein